MEERVIHFPLEKAGADITNTKDNKVKKVSGTETVDNWVIKLGVKGQAYYGSVYCEELKHSKDFSEIECRDESSAEKQLKKYCAIQSGWAETPLFEELFK